VEPISILPTLTETYNAEIEALKNNIEISWMEREKRLTRKMEEQIEEVKHLIKKEVFQNEKDLTLSIHDMDENLMNPIKQSDENKYLSKFKCELRIARFEPMTEINTGTLCMYAVSKVVDDSTSIFKKLFEQFKRTIHTPSNNQVK